MASPIAKGKITTKYKKEGKMWSKGYHTGVDFSVVSGTNVLAAANGQITTANWGKSYGLQLVQEISLHSKKAWVIYAHLSTTCVQPGDKVVKGQHIGTSGNTGNSSGPHLHFEVRNHLRWSSGTDLDPKDVLAL